ncbi:Dabb family protein [Sphingomonas japonica]|uniref:Stress-response A/B barrel domain-containing protein n=1 Tax=Sphingomonas japonica TaxID=511662 RepID=A0ABX0U0G6_9SPHN|nr:Dabb family protein [Sphingomonas japonica]NIJ24045.1 hypothetical protein [Sphingomonas japonica]
MRPIHAALLALAAATLPVAALAQSKTDTARRDARFIHHVFFWLKNSDSAADKARLVAALEKLSAVDTIRSYQIGEPAGTDRDVIDGSYSVSWTLTFDSAADQQAYQVDPIHLQFVEEHSALWQRVQVYDTVPVAE